MKNFIETKMVLQKFALKSKIIY